MGTAPLPRGRHGMSRDDVETSQRNRLERAVAEAVREHGFAQATVAHIVRAAAVSRQTFYELYESKDQCYSSLMERWDAELGATAQAAFAGVRTPEDFAAGARQVFELHAREETLTYCMVFEPGPGGRVAPTARGFTRAAIEAVVGPDDPFAVRGFAAMYRRLIEEEVEAGRTTHLPELASPLGAMLRHYVRA